MEGDNILSEENRDEIVNIKSYMDSFFLIVMGCIVFLMQCGFALLEAGAVRSKNTVNILIKNMLDALIGGVVYWAIGWAFAYGTDSNGFVGTDQFFFYGFQGKDYPSWFFQFVFAATTATIVSGAIAERCTMNAYFAYSVILTGTTTTLRIIIGLKIVIDFFQVGCTLWFHIGLGQMMDG